MINKIYLKQNIIFDVLKTIPFYFSLKKVHLFHIGTIITTFPLTRFLGTQPWCLESYDFPALSPSIQ